MKAKVAGSTLKSKNDRGGDNERDLLKRKEEESEKIRKEMAALEKRLKLLKGEMEELREKKGKGTKVFVFYWVISFPLNFSFRQQKWKFKVAKISTPDE
jgi:hypothetical protein